MLFPSCFFNVIRATFAATCNAILNITLSEKQSQRHCEHDPHSTLSIPGRRERGRGNANTSSVPIRDAGFAGGKTF